MSPGYEKRFDQMIADATVDCYNEEEQVTGLFTMIQDKLVVPFQTQVLGVGVTVEGVELMTDGQVVAICTRDEFRQAVPILDLPLPTPAPVGAEWIEAYRHWLG